jgi:hypothetical protein
MDFAIFRRKFDEILQTQNLPEFQRNVQEMTNCLEILRKSARKIRKLLEISGICEKFSFFSSFFHSSSYFLQHHGADIIRGDEILQDTYHDCGTQVLQSSCSLAALGVP